MIRPARARAVAAAVGLLPWLAMPLPGNVDSSPPRLAVIVSIDQFPQGHLDRVWEHLPAGGFKRLVGEGTLFRNARHLQAATFTGPGHAVQSTGAYGGVNGFIGNRMYVAGRQRSTAAVRDPRYGVPGTELYGSSPWALEADTLADSLLRTHPEARVVAVSLKDRAAIPLAGQGGQAFWFDDSIGRFVTSTFYLESAPSWLDELNAMALPSRDFASWWKRRGPAAAYASAVADDDPGEGEWEGLQRAFPHRVMGKGFKRTKSYYKAWKVSSYGLWGQLEFAKRAALGEGLGSDEVPDLLAISFSSTDYAGHQFGPDSHEVISLTFEIDAVLRELLAFLDDAVGQGGYVLALTSDHGAGPIPEQAQARGEGGGRLRIRTIRRVTDRALTAAYGRGTWVAATETPFVRLNHALIARKGLSRDEVEATAATALRQVAGVEAVLTRSELARGQAGEGDMGRQMLASYHPERTGDLVVVPARHWLWGKYGERPQGTTHGSPWEYDTDVPLIFYGAGVADAIEIEGGAEIVDLAPTLAHLLRIPAPGDAVGRVLQAAIRGPG